jgi:GDP-D-mannose dehydratase
VFNKSTQIKNEKNENWADYFYLDYVNKVPYCVADSKANGFSIRCFKPQGGKSLIKKQVESVKEISVQNSYAKRSLGRTENQIIEKDWSSAHDVVGGLIAIAEQSFVGDVILASGRSTSLIEIIEKAFAYIGIENWQDYVVTDSNLVRSGESKSIQVDPSYAANELNWTASTTTQEWVGQMVQHHLDALT